MSRTSSKFKAREAARRIALERKQVEDAEQRQRDEQETELVTDFLLEGEDREQAQMAVNDIEVRMGKTVERLVGDLRIPYTRAAKLLREPEPELKRLRQLASDVEQPRGRQPSHTPTADLQNLAPTDPQ